MSMLDKIRSVLSDFGTTYYGKANPNITDEWNYYVFRRTNLKKKGAGGTDFTRCYTVAIVREDYIPENHEFEVIKTVREHTGLRLADTDIQYDYTFKGATDLVVEVAIITFAEPLKGCDV